MLRLLKFDMGHLSCCFIWCACRIVSASRLAYPSAEGLTGYRSRIQRSIPTAKQVHQRKRGPNIVLHGRMVQDVPCGSKLEFHSSRETLGQKIAEWIEASFLRMTITPRVKGNADGKGAKLSLSDDVFIEMKGPASIPL